MGFVEDTIITYGLLGIALTSFLSYSLLPVPTEPILLVGVKFFNPFVVLIVAVIGATVGSILNYYIGLKGIRLFFFKPSEKRRYHAEKMFDKWGPLSIIFFSWLPILGDPLILVAGVLRMNFFRMLIYSFIGKLWYFILVIWFGVSIF